MRIATIGSRVEFIAGSTRWQGMVYDRRPELAVPLFIVSLGYPNIFRMRDGEVIVLSAGFSSATPR